jgi:glycosyltransferase involved in cell wall biosynthesis
MRCDVVMWARNGGRTLPKVLSQIDRVIPAEAMHRKILVDDHSVDNTVKIARDFNWEVYENPEGGISAGANEALRHVDCEYFISVEQDVILADDWWDKVPPLLSDDRVAVASGIRLPNIPALRKLYEYVMERYKKNTQKYIHSAFLGVTIDNTIYKTRYIRMLGGFPRLKVSGGVDGTLAKNIFSRSLEWRVNFEVVSTHLRSSILEELKHWYWYGTCAPELGGRKAMTRILLISCYSPLRGVEIALKKRSLEMVFVYPAMRWAMTIGTVRGVFKGERR